MFPKGMEEPAPFSSEEDDILASAFPSFNPSPQSFSHSTSTSTSLSEPPDEGGEGAKVTDAWVDMMEAAFMGSLGFEETRGGMSDHDVGEAGEGDGGGDAPGIQVFPLEVATSSYFAGTFVVNGVPIVIHDREMDSSLDVSPASPRAPTIELRLLND
ncbi:hypothetical protein HDU67_005392, partial [Dinochytrium kinnereticum]